MIRHHPRPDIVRDYARGGLGTGLALAVACHLDGCKACGGEAALWESLGGALLQTTRPIPLALDAFERTVARIAAVPAPRAEKTPSFLARFSLPAPLRRQAIGPRRWVSPNIWIAPVRVRHASRARTYLIHARAGTVIPKHAHSGEEFTAVLHGSFLDNGGCYGAGDFAFSNEHDVHSPTVTAGGDCLCLVGAEAPMQLFSVLARAVQVLSGSLY